MQDLHFVFGQRGGRLVEHDGHRCRFDAEGIEGAGDGDHRLQGERKSPRLHPWVQVDHVDAGERLTRLGVSGRPVDASRSRRRQPAPESEVLRDRQGGHDGEVLMDEPQARPQDVGGEERDVEFLPAHLDPGPRVGAVVSGQALDQRRLATPVLTEQGVDLAAVDVEVDVDQERRPANDLEHRRTTSAWSVTSAHTPQFEVERLHVDVAVPHALGRHVLGRDQLRPHVLVHRVLAVEQPVDLVDERVADPAERLGDG